MFDDPTYPVKMGKFFSIISKPLKTTWPIVACAGSYIYLYTEIYNTSLHEVTNFEIVPSFENTCWLIVK